jgi:N-acetylglucosamine-6-sulfatase
MLGMRRTVVLLASIALAMGLLLSDYYTGPTDDMSKAAGAQERPNIVFILTDDQSEGMLKHMPVLRARLKEKGITFNNTVVSNPLCCPSRTTLQRGQYTHNHQVFSNKGHYGGWPRFDALDLENSTVATWLNGAGYRTGYFGKYMNDYDTRRVPPGWDFWYARVGHSGRMVNANGEIQRLPGDHKDTAFKNRAVEWVKHAAPRDTPFFFQLGMFAPHKPGVYAHKYADDFPDARVPRDPSFNEQDVSDKPSYVRNLPRLTQSEISDMDILYRKQLRSLRTVDDAIRAITDALRSAGELHNTYIVFYTDNGVHRGHHRIRYGKQLPYQTDTRFPMIMRGPRIPANSRSYQLASSNDIAPTLARMGGGAIPSFVDGRSLLPVADGTSPANWRTALLSRHWRADSPLEQGQKPEWSALMKGQQTYVEYETGEREFYRLDTDPYELRNAYDTLSPEAKQHLHTRLENLKSCGGTDSCAKAESGG